MTKQLDATEGGRLADDEHEETTARLLRLGGMRAEVPADRADRVRQAFLDECRRVSRARVIRRRVAAGAAVLSMAAAMALVMRLDWRPPLVQPADALVATIVRVEGAGGRLVNQAGSTQMVRLVPGEPLRAGAQVHTDAAGRIGLRLSNDTSVRLDSGSSARFLSATAMALDAGAVYVDSGAESPPLEVRTPLAAVRDIGTQFEIRLERSSLRVRVRSGIVEVHRGAQVWSARPGSELTLDAGGISERMVPPYGPDWAWAAGLGADFVIEGRSLAAWLEHLCREQGWTLTYVDSALARNASGIILHGSIAGVPPSDALAIVLPTTGLTYRLKDGELLVTTSARP